jgi:hypothetical protein
MRSQPEVTLRVDRRDIVSDLTLDEFWKGY